MTGKIECTVAPVQTEDLQVGDIVLCKVGGSQYLHLVKAVQGRRFQIGNNRGGINGWIGAHGVYGRCVRVESETKERSTNRLCLVFQVVAVPSFNTML